MNTYAITTTDSKPTGDTDAPGVQNVPVTTTHVIREDTLNKLTTLANMVADTNDTKIPLPVVLTQTFKNILECLAIEEAATDKSDVKKPAETTSADIVTKTTEFFKDGGNAVVFEATLAADFLGCDSVLNVLCKIIAEQIRGKSPEEIRTLFNIKNDFTPEEEEEVRKENAWAEDA
jgi:S-phase kinase-associated protein 1